MKSLLLPVIKAIISLLTDKSAKYLCVSSQHGGMDIFYLCPAGKLYRRHQSEWGWEYVYLGEKL